MNQDLKGMDFPQALDSDAFQILLVVIDFVNDPQQILEDFQVYFRAAQMPGGSDPEVLIRLQAKLDADGYYLESELEAFYKFYWSPTGAHSH